MKTKNKQPEKSIVILLSAIVSAVVLLLLPLTNEAIEKVVAASIMLPSNTQATTPINSIDAETKNNSLFVVKPY